MLTSVQKEILQCLINLYRETKCTSVKGENIAELMNRNSGTIRNQMQALRSLGLVKGVPGPRGGYKPTLEAYQTLHIKNDPCDIQVPIMINGKPVWDITVNKIEFTSILQPGDCEATLSILGDIKQLDLDDEIRIGPTPVNNLMVEGVIVGRDDMDNVLLVKTSNIHSIPKMKVNEIATTDVILLKPTMKVKEVAKILYTNKIKCAPVVENEEIVGIFTLSLLAKAVSEENYDVEIEKYMSKHVITARDNITLIRAIEIMRKNEIETLTLENKGEISGIISIIDIFDQLAVLK